MRAVVVALGKIGLPIAVQLARAGHDVTGCDIDPRVVETVAAGRAPFPGEAHLDEYLAEAVAAGRLRATTDTTAAVAAGADLVICVPPLIVDADATPDWRALDAVMAAVGAGLRRGDAPTTVSIETTLPVGSTRGRLAPGLVAASGRRGVVDLFSCFSGERVVSGRVFADLATYPKLVGGLSDAGEARAVALYASFLPDAEVRGMGGAEAAELTKLVETTYRDVNIALANEFARHADALGLDVQQVIDAANSQPFSHVHRPGVAVGGHCIPVYPRFYLQGDPAATLPAAARAANERMPAYAVDLLGDAAAGRVLILGVAYRGDVKETAFSGAFGVRDAIAARGGTPVAADPLYDETELRALGFDPWDGGPVDAALLQADHAAYRTLGPADLPGARVVVDGRGVLDPAPFAAAGVALTRIGS
jgi:UDP-N-acetyl-D-mannosaminuronic acid dehydrogenase